MQFLKKRLLIVVKRNVILRFVSLNIWESMHIQVKKSSLPNNTFGNMLVCNNIVSFKDFPVLANGTNDFRIKLKKVF